MRKIDIWGFFFAAFSSLHLSSHCLPQSVSLILLDDKKPCVPHLVPPPTWTHKCFWGGGVNVAQFKTKNVEKVETFEPYRVIQCQWWCGTLKKRFHTAQCSTLPDDLTVALSFCHSFFAELILVSLVNCMPSSDIAGWYLHFPSSNQF